MSIDRSSSSLSQNAQRGAWTILCQHLGIPSFSNNVLDTLLGVFLSQCMVLQPNLDNRRGHITTEKFKTRYKEGKPDIQTRWRERRWKCDEEKGLELMIWM